MPRTPEQVAADDALTEAIEQASRAYGIGDAWSDEDLAELGVTSPPPMVLTEYVVVTYRRGWLPDGSAFGFYGRIHRDNDVPVHVCLGLAEYAATRWRAEVTG